MRFLHWWHAWGEFKQTKRGSAERADLIAFQTGLVRLALGVDGQVLVAAWGRLRHGGATDVVDGG